MKTSALILGILVAVASLSVADLRFIVIIDGIQQRNVIKDGLRPAELSQLTLMSNDKAVGISEFEIIHVRGASPVHEAVLTNTNTYDLKHLRPQAKPGDRIVIKIKNVTGGHYNRLSEENSTILIPVR